MKDNRNVALASGGTHLLCWPDKVNTIPDQCVTLGNHFCCPYYLNLVRLEVQLARLQIQSL